MKGFSIHVEAPPGSSYKSIRNIDWEDIPALAILTGPNGSGKSQLLELIAHGISGAKPSWLPSASHSPQGFDFPVSFKAEGRSYDAADVAYIPDDGRLGYSQPLSLAQLTNFTRQAASQAGQTLGTRSGWDITRLRQAKRIQERLGGRIPGDADGSELSRADPLEFLLDDLNISAGLSFVFMKARLKRLEQLERADSTNRGNRDVIVTEQQAPPWIQVDEALAL